MGEPALRLEEGNGEAARTVSGLPGRPVYAQERIAVGFFLEDGERGQGVRQIEACRVLYQDSTGGI